MDPEICWFYFFHTSAYKKLSHTHLSLVQNVRKSISAHPTTFIVNRYHRDILVETACRLCYIYGLCTSMELIPLPVVPLVLEFCIQLGQAGRKAVRGGVEEGWSEGVESFSSYIIHHLARLGSSMLPSGSNIS
jgi:hypothetical protein